VYTKVILNTYICIPDF